MSKKVFVPKDDQALPDFYTVSILYVTGKEVTLEVAGHKLVERVVLKEKKNQHGQTMDTEVSTHPTPFFEFWTTDDRCVFVPVSNIVEIRFDKDWTKVVQVFEKGKKDKIEEDQEK